MSIAQKLVLTVILFAAIIYFVSSTTCPECLKQVPYGTLNQHYAANHPELPSPVIGGHGELPKSHGKPHGN
ncbi:hypothetical protein DdX_21873 [Ditylenchus destructor]|uniref:Uncharacterized protein n=1 Tax=Ditylenchus destructor TaxID=166010 RepID=A0AAD4MGL6_9BILA|nr:hypothetical protein DdX_21873 [Ditylenchus destructor]